MSPPRALLSFTLAIASALTLPLKLPLTLRNRDPDPNPNPNHNHNPNPVLQCAEDASDASVCMRALRAAQGEGRASVSLHAGVYRTRKLYTAPRGVHL